MNNDFTTLINGVNDTASRIKEIISSKKNILIIGHMDADGIASSSVMARTIQREGGRFNLRIMSEMTIKELENISGEAYDYHILCEVGGGLSAEIDKHLNDKWILIDHHEIPESELKHERVFNVWKYDVDGSKEVSATGLTYMISKSISSKNVDLSWLPIIAALADRQDQGEGKALISLNKNILSEAVSEGLIEVSKDLAFYGRETRPIHFSISSTTNPFLSGLTGNSDACLATLKSIGIEVKEEDRWRTISDLSEDEKKKLVEAIVPFVTNNDSIDEHLNGIISDVYVLKNEDPFTQLRDAREFGTLLNACARIGKPSVGIAICMEERGEYLSAAMETSKEYRSTLSKYVRHLENNENVKDDGKLVYLSGKGVVHEYVTGTVASILSSNNKFKNKLLILGTDCNDGEFKISARRPAEMDQINLGELLREAAVKCGGVGGGHSAAAGAKIPEEQVNNFLNSIQENLKDQK